MSLEIVLRRAKVEDFDLMSDREQIRPICEKLYWDIVNKIKFLDTDISRKKNGRHCVNNKIFVYEELILDIYMAQEVWFPHKPFLTSELTFISNQETD